MAALTASKRHIVAYALFLLTGAATIISAVAAPVVQCPAEIPKSAANLAQAPVGWTAYNPDRIPLSAAGFAAGPPAMEAELKPYSSETRKTGSISTWKFAVGEFVGGDGLWLSCAYGDKSQIILSRQIDSAVAECTVSYKPSKIVGITTVVVACR